MTKRRKERQDRLAESAGKSNPLKIALKAFLKNPPSMAALIILILLIASAILAGFLFDYQTDIIGLNPADRLQFPSSRHWFGTDSYGRDIFRRVLYGARYSLFIAIVTSAVSMVLGILIGATAAYFGGPTMP